MGSKDKFSTKSNSSFLTITSTGFLFIGIFSLSFTNFYAQPKIASGVVEKTLGASAESAPEVIDNYPELIDSSDFSLDAKSALAIDMDSGTILYEKNSEEPVMPASTEKVITALVAFDVFDLKQKVTVPEVSIEGQNVGLQTGEVLTIEDLLYALLVPSANDAAEVLAALYPDGRAMFIEKMNVKASSLGLKNSVFLNPSGLDEEGQTTTARDLVKASFYAMQNPEFRKIVGTKNYRVVGENGVVTHRFTNINQLLGEVDGVKGVKTGKTDGAMENLITFVERDDHRVLTAVLGSTDRFSETKKLINWIFSSFSWSE